MSFVHPSWLSGLLFYILIILGPFLVFMGLVVYGWIKENDKVFVIGVVCGIVALLICVPGSFVAWHYAYEVPSVESKIVAVDSWQPRPGLDTQDGMMTINDASELMLVTTDGEGFINEENFLFGKFDTRDITNNMKPNGTYNITFFGWREGFNSGFPNILSINEVVDDSHAVNKSAESYFGTKLMN